MVVLQFWALVLLPPLVFAVWIHLLEGFMQRRLAAAFGWRSVLVTGWFGTPVHELSHAAACLMFRHRIDEIQLFEPDPKEGRLGYVRHSYRRGNWYEELGNVFIGTAPLIGGTVVLMLLLGLFYPGQIAAFFAETRTGLAAGGLDRLPALVMQAAGSLFTPSNLATLRFWVFVFLTVCVASHMAPSRSDYAGAFRGVLLLLAIAAALTVLVFGILRLDGEKVVNELAVWLMPLFVVASLAAALVTVAAALVMVLTALVPRGRWLGQ